MVNKIRSFGWNVRFSLMMNDIPHGWIGYRERGDIGCKLGDWADRLLEGGMFKNAHFLHL